MKNKLSLFLLMSLLLLCGCRGWRSEKPPVHPNPNMDWQAKYKAQMFSKQPPKGTIPWGRESVYKNNQTRDDYSQENTGFYKGTSKGRFVKKAPINVDKEVLIRGQERYNIYCSMCHGYTGAGDGTVVQKGFHVPTSIHTKNVRNYTDGELFHVITNGRRNMPAYKKQIQAQDRWAIVTYIRALQRSQNTSVKELPKSLQAQLEKGR